MSEERKTDDMKAESSEHINLTVKGSDDKPAIHFKIKKNTQMKKLMNVYCDRTGIAHNTVKFMFDGTHVVEEDTPASLELEDNDTIEVYSHQTGGNNLS